MIGFACAALAQTAAVASVPPLIRVSGTISGDSGGTVGVTFALYAEQTGGAPLWLETQNVAVGEKGRYTIFLGINHAQGVPMDLFASGEARWLGVQPEGQAEQARVQLVSVPYAMTAGDAKTLGGQPLSAFVMASSANGASPTTASGTATAAASGSGIVALATPQGTGGNVTTTLGGTTNYLAKFTTSTNVENSSLVYDSGTAVGIGTTAPAATFHVVSTTTAAGIVDVYNNALTGVTFSTRAARGTPTLPAVVQAGDIIGGFTGKGWTGSGGFSGGRGALIIHANETWSSTGQSTYMQFNTTALGTAAQAERMRIDNAGNVGIGTTNPGQVLDVNGTIRTANGLIFPSGVLTSQGSLGIGTTSPSAPLEANGNIKLTAGSGGGLIFADGTKQTTAGVKLISPDSSLTVGGTDTAPTAVVNTGLIQQRVTGACGSGAAINTVNTNGSVSCQTVSGGGALTAPVAISGGGTPPNYVFSATQTDNGPTPPSGPSAGMMNGIPAAIVGTSNAASGLGMGVLGIANGPFSIGIVGFTSSTGGMPAIMAFNGSTSGGDGLDAWNSSPADGAAIVAEALSTGGDENKGPAALVLKIHSPYAAGIYFSSDYSSSTVKLIQSPGFTVDGTGAVTASSLNLSGAANVGNVYASSYNGPHGQSVVINNNTTINGDLTVTGGLGKGMGSFRIDHPLDPANKYLYHSFVESPDMMNVYNGNVTTDGHGLATVVLPDYFEALNRDFRYQLTVIGQFAQAIVAKKVANSRFVIRTNKPRVEVSWQVTGIRQDAYANAHRIQVEEEKTGTERGTYLHPELVEKQHAVARANTPN
jgi:hypothetical protein